MDPTTVTNSGTPPPRPNLAQPSLRTSLRQRMEYYAALILLKLLGALPHRLTRALCAILAFLSYWFWPRLRRVGLFNLKLAFPDWPESQRRKCFPACFVTLAGCWQILPIFQVGTAATLRS